MEDPVVAPAPTGTVSTAQSFFTHSTTPIRAEALDDGFTLLIGPDNAGNLYEVGVVDSEDGPVIVHAMLARAKYLR